MFTSKRDECQVGEDFIPCRDDGPFSSGFVEDVIPHVCKFLGIQDIKHCRLVCKSWNYGATSVLKNKTIIIIPLYPKKSDSAHTEDETKDKLTFSHTNVCLVMGGHQSMDPKIFDEVTNLKSIVVRSSTKKPLQKDLFHKIILNSASTLKTFIFGGGESLEFPSFRGVVLPKLTHLAIYHFWDEGSQDIERIGHAITEAFPALQHVKIAYRYMPGLSEMKFLPKFPTSVNSLELHELLDINRMNCLLEFMNPLKTLKFSSTSFQDLVDDLPLLFYKFLKKQSPTLEKLCLQVSVNRIDKLKLDWIFPAFPVMQNLTICNSDMFAILKFEITPGTFAQIDYKICLPVLQILRVCRTYSIPNMAQDLSCMAGFLPLKGDNAGPVVVESVKVVDLYILDNTLTTDCNSAKADLSNQLLKIFPNAMGSIKDMWELVV
ncbi:uncharacterized protein LOC110860387 [Folsomia candida]|uniref:uncharacterized protein LOC110860387 n=1 Tax=Folsomia candida TaxID=158441 RepID=UPI000B906B21|nr:uncharacterized protein LOC110860387 [Folsomia candida]XP_035716303.1 uncharacterized protein LOC110860387 [Folsomia candida]